MVSRIEFDSPSRKDGNVNRSEPCNISKTTCLQPAKITLSITPSFLAWPCSTVNKGPSPIRINTAFVGFDFAKALSKHKRFLRFMNKPIVVFI